MKSQKTERLPGSLLLLITAVIWGSGFATQRLGMEHVQPFTFLSTRFILASLSLLPMIIWRRRQTQGGGQPLRALLAGGLSCGIILFCASSLQQIGIVTTTAGKAGFITALYIILVPLIGILFGRRLTWQVVCGVLLAVSGLYLLSVKEGLNSINPGDLIVLSGTFFWSLHILAIDHFVAKMDPLELSSLQFVVAGVLGFFPMVVWERPVPEALWAAAPSILYSGLIVAGLAYTLQIIGQRNTHPTIAALILSLESVFAVVFGFLILHEVMTGPELLGCAFMLAGVILAQFDGSQKVQGA